MTDWELLKNDHPTIDLCGQYLMSISAAYPEAEPPPEYFEDAFRCHSPPTIRQHFKLTDRGKLILLRYSFFTFRDYSPQIVDHVFSGDFTTKFGILEDGSKTVIPFIDGTIVEDVNQWRFEESRIRGTVTKESMSGFHVVLDYGQYGTNAFLPRSQAPSEFQSDMSSYVGMKDEFETLAFDQQRQHIFLTTKHLS